VFKEKRFKTQEKSEEFNGAKIVNNKGKRTDVRQYFE
jgi:hypothetical protein